MKGLHGLASVLQSLHGFRLGDLNKSLIGYHHDVKPRNILIFRDGSNSKSPLQLGQGHYLAPDSCMSNFDIRGSLVQGAFLGLRRAGESHVNGRRSFADGGNQN